MTDARRPIARLTYRTNGQTFSILSIWAGKFPGTYDVSRDKPSDKRQVIGLFDALKGWGSGSGYLSITVESERDRNSSQPVQHSPRQTRHTDSNGDWPEGEIPFRQYRGGEQ